MSEPLYLFHRHLKQLQFCNRGARQWFLRHGIDWRLFLEHGVDLVVIERVGDEFARRAVAHVKAENERLKHG